MSAPAPGAGAWRAITRQAGVWLSLILVAEAVYVLGFLRPFPLLEYYRMPRMDLGTLTEHSQAGCLAYAAAMGMLFLVYGLAFRWSRRGNGLGLRWVLLGGCLFATTAAWVFPFGAIDVFDNIFYGRMASVYGANPLVTVPVFFAQDSLYPYVAWWWWPLPYGPVWAAVDEALSRLAGGDLLGNLLAFKALNVALYAACLALIAGVLRRRWPRYLVPGVLLFAWNPLVILEGMASAHNDLALLALVLLALYLYERRALLGGYAALLASVLVKFVSAPLVPLYLVAAWQSLGRRPTRVLALTYACAGLALSVLALLALYVPYYNPAGPVQDVVLVPFHQADLFTTSIPALVAFVATDRLGQKTAHEAVRNLALGLWAAFTAVQTLRLWWRRTDLFTAAYRVLLFYLLFVCLWFQPWYVVWLVALVPLLGPTREAAGVLLFALLAQIKYIVFDFAWFWRVPMDEVIAPDVLSTILIFGPLLLYFAWTLVKGRSARALPATS